MFRILATVATLAAVPSLAAAPATQFNLVCSGTLTNDDKVEPYTATYRVDLAKKQWCEQECKALHAIAAIQPVQLTLDDQREDTPSGRSSLLNIIDRETGAHKIITSSSSSRFRGLVTNLRWEGSCEPAPFSGFPDLPVKF